MGFRQRDFMELNTDGSSGPALRIEANDDGSIAIKSQGTTLLSKAAGASSPLVPAAGLGPVPNTPGAGISAAERYVAGVTRIGNLIKTEIVIDLTGLVSSTTDLDIIGNTGGAASAHFGQITAALNGTIIAARVTCLEVPAGGPDDIDIYSATVGTGAQDGAITGLVETELLAAGGAWASGETVGLPVLPAADSFLYLVNGEASVPGTFTAGKFLLEFWGV